MTPNASRLSPAVARSSDDEVLDRVFAISSAPLLPGEKEADYARLVTRVVGAAEPRDTIEELLIRDVIDLSWEIARQRRVKAGILKASMSDGVQEVLDNLGHGQGQGYGYTRELGRSWATGDKSAQKEVARALNAAGLAIDEVTAKTLESRLDSFERLDRMLASAEARRNNALREIDRHRDVLGAAVRSSIDEAEDVVFQDVETGQTGGEAQP